MNQMEDVVMRYLQLRFSGRSKRDSDNMCEVAISNPLHLNNIMYQIKERYGKIAEKKPYLSTYMVFAETIRNTDITENTIRRWFYKLVDPEDYAKSEVRVVLQHLVALAKPSKV